MKLSLINLYQNLVLYLNNLDGIMENSKKLSGFNVKLCKITNLISSSVSIQDIGVYLPGKGSTKIIDYELSIKSKDLKNNKLVKIEYFNVRKIEPKYETKSLFSKNEHANDNKTSIEQEINKEDLRLINENIKEIKSMLLNLHNQQHDEKINDKQAINVDKPEVDNELLFIPSKITPDNIESNMKTDEQHIDDDFSITKEKLKKLIGKRK